MLPPRCQTRVRFRYPFYARHYCRVYISPTTGEVVAFEQDSDGFEIAIPTTPKFSKEAALELAKEVHHITDVDEKRTKLDLIVHQDDVGEQYLGWDISIYGTNPKIVRERLPPDDPFYLVGLGGGLTIDAMTGEILKADHLMSSPGLLFKWPAKRGIDVWYFDQRLHLYQPPIRKEGKLYWSKGFFPPFLVEVKENRRKGTVTLTSLKGKKDLQIGKEALIVNDRLLIQADLLVEMSPEKVMIEEQSPQRVILTWDYKHRRTPYPEPKAQ